MWTENILRLESGLIYTRGLECLTGDILRDERVPLNVHTYSSTTIVQATPPLGGVEHRDCQLAIYLVRSIGKEGSPAHKTY